MCEDCRRPDRTLSNPREESANAMIPKESHIVYELKQKREYHIQQIVNIQKAIDAANMIGGLY